MVALVKACICLLMAIPAQQGRTLHVSERPLAGVTPETQFRRIGDAAKGVHAGDRVLIHTGVYREAVEIAASGNKAAPIVFEAAPFAHVVVTGADLLTDLREEHGEPSDRIYSAPWPHRFIGWNPSRAHPDDDFHRLIGRAEQVFVGGYALRQVLRREQLARGTFCVDEAAQRLFLWAANNEKVGPGSRVEASTRPVIWSCKGDYVTVRGIRFLHAANHAQEGAAQFAGRGDVIEECAFEEMNASGAAFAGPDQVVRRCTFRDNGQLGWGANRAHNLLFTGCLTEGNNTKGWDRGWEAGGDKLVLSRGVIIERSRFVRNRGCGVWFDIGNESCTVRDCSIADNEDAGIFYEISYGLHAHDNLITGNGFADTPGAWGAAAGICLSSSPGCLIERNRLIANKEGFNFREQTRDTPRIDQPRTSSRGEAIWNHDETICNNVIAYNRDAQTWGWFDMGDERNWPRAMQAMPGRLSLESLHITMAQNTYGVTDGQELFHWGPKWRKNRAYSDLATLQRELGLERGSVVKALDPAELDTIRHSADVGRPANP